MSTAGRVFAATPRGGERAARCLDGVDGDGIFLDVGAANGLLLESLVMWGAERRWRIDPWGVDTSAALVALARDRLPRWADRFAVGDGRTWSPPGGRRFDAVRSELGYVADTDQERFARRLLDDLVAPGGRLIICSYLSTRIATSEPPSPAEEIRGWGWDVAGEAAAIDPWTGKVFTRIAWVSR
ncbi:MAG: class I SAM-dependent methyltransferase [Chloroflexi bacterium]|nr:class I SAM-dependent methyltransferase [Chloroflexota bacterium]